MKQFFAFLGAFSFILLILVPCFSVAKADPMYIFQDSFETGNLSQWNGKRASPGETIGVSSYRSCIGAYAGRATSNGSGGVEYAYLYKKMSSSELYVYATFYVARSGIVDEGDRFYLMAFQAGSNTLAGAGWRKINGITKWFLLVRNAANFVISYSAESPILNKWYSVKLHWVKSSSNGGAQLYIGDTTYLARARVLSITGKNTAAYGNISEVRLGLPTVSYCGNTAVYFDCVRMSNEYIAEIYDCGWHQDVFTEGYESGNFNAWSQVNTYNSGRAQVINTQSYSGIYSAKFTVGISRSLSGQAYCYKNIHLPASEYSILNRFTGAFKVSSINIAGSNGRIYLFRAWSGNVEVIAAGIEKVNGVLHWFISRKDGTTTSSIYSNEIPILDKWFTIGVSWNPFDYIWGTCGCDLTISYADGSSSVYIPAGTVNPVVYPKLDRVDIGLTKTINCRSATVYADDFTVTTWMWE